jgi:hypothetical protein
VVLKDSKVLLEDKVRKGVLVPKELKVSKVPEDPKVPKVSKEGEVLQEQ